LVALCTAYDGGYGQSSSAGVAYGVAGTGAGYAGPKVISAAVQTRYSSESRPTPLQPSTSQPTIVEVDGGELPLEIVFKSTGSRIRVRQLHSGPGGGSFEETSSEDEPTRLLHTVRKPIVQEVREIITPFRRIVQEIQPVQEEIHTVVAKSDAGSSAVGLGPSGGGFSSGNAAFGADSGTGFANRVTVGGFSGNGGGNYGTMAVGSKVGY